MSKAKDLDRILCDVIEKGCLGEPASAAIERKRVLATQREVARAEQQKGLRCQGSRHRTGPIPAHQWELLSPRKFALCSPCLLQFLAATNGAEITLRAKKSS